MGLATFNKHRNPRSITKPAEVIPLPPVARPRNEKLSDRLVRFDREAEEAKTAVKRALLALDDAKTSLAAADTDEDRENAFAGVNQAQDVVDQLATFAEAATLRANTLRVKLTDKSLTAQVARLEELRSLATRQELERLVHEELVPRAIGAFREVVAIAARADEMLRAVRDHVAELRTVAGAIGVSVDEPADVDLDQARGVILRALTDLTEREGLPTGASLEWLSPGRKGW